MYKFIKIKLRQNNEVLPDWYFSPKTIDEVSEHWDKYAQPNFKEHIDEWHKQLRLDTFKNNENILLGRGGQCMQIVPFDICKIIESKECEELEYPN